MKSFLTITTMLLLSSFAHGESELSLAFKGGPNTATLAKTYRTNRYGFSGGFSGRFQRSLIDRFSLGAQIELLYTPRGAEVIFEGDYLGQVRQHYVDVMAAARPELRLGQVGLYVLLGGGLNLLVSANKQNVSGVEEDITSDLRRIDVALLAGAGIALHLPPQELGPFHLGTVLLEARHDIGLIDTDAVNGGFKNRTSSLMLGLSLQVGSSPSPATAAGSAD